jgi:DNA-binding response OmpR family regulator
MKPGGSFSQEGSKENMKKILLIHGHASIWESLAKALADDGYLVVPIGRSALSREMILTLEPDLVLLDWNIDEKGKGDVLEEVKKQAPLHEPPCACHA